MPSANAYAIFTVDPGVTTGCASALIDTGQPTVAAAMRRARGKGLLWTWEETGSHTEQAWSICKKATDFFFKYHVEKQYIRANRALFVIEDFQLRQMGVDLMPVRIQASIETLLYGAYGSDFEDDEFYTKQQPSHAKGFCTDRMLKSWNLWHHLSPHQRDAARHLAKKVDRLLG